MDIKGSKFAFTLAEVLITLGIIGVVAAMTLPALMHANQAKVNKTQLSKAYSVLAQAHQMMLVKDIFPYETFVAPFLVPEDDNTDEGGDSGDAGSGGDSGTGGDVDNPSDPGDGGSQPDINDKRTKELVDGIIDALFPLDIETIKNNVSELIDMYGTNNLGKFIKDYASQSGVELPGWFEDLLGDNSSFGTENMMYKKLFALSGGTSQQNDMSANFVQVKQYQLKVLKNLLNGASYCERYDKCDVGKPYIIYTLSGQIADVEVAEFNNSALKTSDGMYIWLGDINNPQRYFVDINGAKRPNKYGVDVFTFDITPKQSISPEKNANCTTSGTPLNGETYRGLGCAGYAILDESPNGGKGNYWKDVK